MIIDKAPQFKQHETTGDLHPWSEPKNIAKHRKRSACDPGTDGKSCWKTWGDFSVLNLAQTVKWLWTKETALKEKHICKYIYIYYISI